VRVRGFGGLEAVIMEFMWRRSGPATGRDVHGKLATQRVIAYTTVMTVLDNLHRKGFLDRRLVGRAFAYEPTASQEEYTASLMRQALAESGDHGATLAYFVEQMTDEETRELRKVLRADSGGRQP
jgi:predicted transcriptional regulator